MTEALLWNSGLRCQWFDIQQSKPGISFLFLGIVGDEFVSEEGENLRTLLGFKIILSSIAGHSIDQWHHFQIWADMSSRKLRLTTLRRVEHDPFWEEDIREIDSIPLSTYSIFFEVHRTHETVSLKVQECRLQV